MPTTTAKNQYHHLNKTDLVALVMERDATIAAQRQELIHAQEQISHISRILGLRNRKIFGSATEKQGRTCAVTDLAYEEVKGEDRRTDIADSGPGIGGGCITAVEKKRERRQYRNGHPGRSPIPAHIRREVVHFYPEGYEDSWNREMPPEVTERLSLHIDFFVRVEVRHKFARGSSIVVAPCPLEDPFYKYKATTELVCNMMYLRFALHVPYYRFMQLLPDCGLSYSTLIGWAARAFDMLAPLGPLLAQEILKRTKLLSMDETPFKLLDRPDKIAGFKAALIARQEVNYKGLPESDAELPLAMAEEDGDMEAEIAAGVAKGKVVLKGQMWTLLNATTGMVMFRYGPSRATINAAEMLSGYQGLLMADAYTAYQRLAKLSADAITLLSCWAHARRRVLESQDPKYQDPVVQQIIRRIGRLYEIEKQIKGLSPRKRKKIRKRSKKLLCSLKGYLEQVIDHYTPKDAVRVAIQYILNHWKALSVYVEHKHGIIDNNPTERILKPITVARKNILFLGSADHAPGAALLYSLIECCKLQNIDPQEWLLDVMKRIEYYPKDQLVNLLPHRWKMDHQHAQASH